MMPTEADRLLLACWQHPADMDQRLVYADWLEEHGEPQAAELVRVEVERLRVGIPRPTLIAGYQDHIGNKIFCFETPEFIQYINQWLPRLRVDLKVYRGGAVLKSSVIYNAVITKSQFMHSGHQVWVQRDGLSGKRYRKKEAAAIHRQQAKLLTAIRGLEPVAIGTDGLCRCTCGTLCPLGKTGSATRCSRDQLAALRIATVE